MDIVVLMKSIKSDELYKTILITKNDGAINKCYSFRRACNGIKYKKSGFPVRDSGFLFWNIVLIVTANLVVVAVCCTG